MPPQAVLNIRFLLHQLLQYRPGQPDRDKRADFLVVFTGQNQLKNNREIATGSPDRAALVPALSNKPRSSKINDKIGTEQELELPEFEFQQWTHFCVTFEKLQPSGVGGNVTSRMITYMDGIASSQS